MKVEAAGVEVECFLVHGVLTLEAALPRGGSLVLASKRKEGKSSDFLLELEKN